MLMMPRYKSRFLLGITLLVGIFLLINGLTISLLALAGHKALEPLLLISLLITFSIGFPLLLLLARRFFFPPYRQLIDEAERAPIANRSSIEKDETEFVLETFQSVVAQLQTQGQQLEKLRALASARAESAEKFSERIVASVPSGLIAFNAAGQANMVNDVARELIGVETGAEGQLVRELLRRAPDLAELIEHCLQTGELRRREEFSVRGTDESSPRKLGATVAPIEFANDRGVICLLTDLTEVIELREALALKKNLESLGEMSAGLAHELKNSLATLHSYAQLLQNPLSTKESQTAATALLQEVRSLSDMATAFLNFANPHQLHLEPTPLRETIDSCVEELAPLLDERHVQISIIGDFPVVQADDRLLRQALLNLLRNAAEAIDNDCAEYKVTVRSAQQQDRRGKHWALVEITDTGRGIPIADLQRIFIPFFTTKSKGHGVGLALAHRIITEHGGTVSAANAQHGGACFTIKLPMATEV